MQRNSEFLFFRNMISSFLFEDKSDEKIKVYYFNSFESFFFKGKEMIILYKINKVLLRDY